MRQGLERLGFEPVPGSRHEYVLRCNSEAGIYVHDGIEGRFGWISINPVISVTIESLRQALVAQDPSWQNSSRVCHAWIYSLGGWTSTDVPISATDEETKLMVARCIGVIEALGIPLMRQYGCLEKAIELFRAWIENPDDVHSALVVVFAEQKLHAAEEVIRKSNRST